MVGVFILFVVLALLSLFFGGIYKTNAKACSSFVFGMLCTLWIILSVLFGYGLWSKQKAIYPIDVYRGNTTLEITYKDGVAIDSVVVWK